MIRLKHKLPLVFALFLLCLPVPMTLGLTLPSTVHPENSCYKDVGNAKASSIRNSNCASDSLPNVYTASGRTITKASAASSPLVIPSSLNGCCVFVNDFNGGDKVDVSLRNLTMLDSSGYVRSGRIRVIALSGIRIRYDAYALCSLNQLELSSLSARLKQLNGRITCTYTLLPFVGVELPYEKIDEFAQDAHVGHVFLDQKCYAQLSQSVPLIKPPDKWSQIEQQYGFSINGTGVKIAVLDTGIDKSHPDLDDLDGNPATNDPKVIAEKCFTDENHTWDGYGHGTHCASIAAGTGQASNYTYVGVAPGAYLLNGKVLDDSGSGWDNWVMSGLEWAVNNSANVISMSFGADWNNDGTDPLSIAVDWAVSMGVTCVAAAGNSGNGGYLLFSVGTPGCSRKVITVGATDLNDEAAWFSSEGPTSDYRLKPDVCAPGVDIVAARANGTKMGKTIDDYYTTASGTSMATPHVAGAAALLLQIYPDWSPMMVKVAVMGSSKLLNTSLWKQGAGRIDVCAAANTTLLITEPSASFGALGAGDSVWATMTITNLADLPASVNISTAASSCGVETSFAAVNVTWAVIVPHGNVSVSLTIGPFGDFASEGWYEGQMNVTVTSACARCPYLFAVKNLVEDPTWKEVATLDLGYSCRNPHRLLKFGDYLYAGGWDIPGKIVKIDPATFTVVANLTLLDGEEKVNSLEAYGNYLYAGLATIPGKVAKVDLSTFIVNATISLDSVNVLALVVKDGYLYASFSQGPGMIQKIALDTFTIVGTLEFSSDEDSAKALTSVNGYLYAGVWAVRDKTGWNAHYSRILKIDPTTFRVVARLDLKRGEEYPMGFAVVNDSLYTALWGCSRPAKIVRIDTVSFTEADVISLSIDDNWLSSFTAYNGCLYAGFGSSPGRIVKIATVPFVKVASLTLNQGENDVVGLAVVDGDVYAGLWTGDDPGKIVKTVFVPSYTYTLTVLSADGGTTNPPPGKYNYLTGMNATIVATPDSGHLFDHWIIDSNGISSNATITVSMKGNHTIQPVFILIQYSLTIMNATGGSTYPTLGNYSYTTGSSVQVTVIPDADYRFDHWLLDGSNAGKTNPITVTMDANHTLQPVFVLIQYQLTVTSSTGGSTDPAAGDYSYTSGSSVQVTAIPAANYVFDHWILDEADAGKINPMNLLMNRNLTLQAVFAIINYTLAISPSAGGTTTPSHGNYSYPAGSSISVGASPSPGYLFDHWTLDGADAGSSLSLSVLADKNHTLQATFVRIVQLTIVASTGGATSPSTGVYNYTQGTIVQVTVSPDANYVLTGWLVDNSMVNATGEILVQMDTDHTIQAVFVQVTFTLAIPSVQGGTTSPPSGTYTYTNGTNVSVNATANAGYAFNYWVLDGQNAGTSSPIMVTMSGNHTLQAVFAQITTSTEVVTLGGARYVFSVESSSTVSALAFNTTSSELSFTVSGPLGTRGCVKVTIAKSLIENVTNIKVYLDGNESEYSVASNGNSWLLTFDYAHSTHRVAINLGAIVAPGFPSTMILSLLMTISILVTIAVLVTIAARKFPRKGSTLL